MNMQDCHQLTQTNGITELAYLGAKPWHGLGQSIREGASVEEMQTAAGMNWRIERATVQFSTLDMDPILQLPRMQPRSVKDRVVLWRYSISTHPRVTAPTGEFISFALTPSDSNAHRQFERDVRRLKRTLALKYKEQTP